MKGKVEPQKSALEVPERFSAMKHWFTPAVLRLTEQRLFGGKALVTGRKPAVPMKLAEVKLALLLVHHINPLESFGMEEEALIRGLSTDTLTRHREQARLGNRPELKRL